MQRKVVVAAGGIVWRDTPQGRRCAIVFRRRYGGEPGLPKGKVKSGESLEQAAVREVQEETGAKAVPLAYAGALYYSYDGTDKVVVFWNMEALDEPSFEGSEEVERVAWLSPQEALDTLVHAEEKELLAQFADAAPASAQARLLDWRRRAWVRVVSAPRHTRLAGTLKVAQIEIEQRAAAAGGEPWVRAARTLLWEARRALAECRIDPAWKCLHAARRMELFGMDEKVELPAAVATLRAEAEKLGSWRRKTLEELVAARKKDEEPVSAAAAYRASWIRDEHYENQAYKDVLVGGQLLALAAIMAIVMLAVVAFFDGGRAAEDASPPLFAIALFGFLGATMSAALRASDAGQPSRIPEITSANRVTFMRVLVGGASAIAIYSLLRSDLIGVVLSGDLAKAIKDKPEAAYAIAFAAGFSERLVRRAVEKLAGKESERDKGKKAS